MKTIMLQTQIMCTWKYQQDKKGRLYLISKLESTKCDLKGMHPTHLHIHPPTTFTPTYHLQTHPPTHPLHSFANWILFINVVLAKRLGLPKDSLRMAAAELMQEVLGVPLGSATPLAAANPAAAQVVLLLDELMKLQPQLLVHPLTNTATTIISPAHLETFLRCVDLPALLQATPLANLT